MNFGDSRIDGPDSRFRTTVWSDIVAAGDPSAPDHREHLERLCRTYWKPVFAYVRLAWHKPIEDAKDLTQAFFGRLLERNYWMSIRPERGSFRGYLMAALRHFLSNAKRHDIVRAPIVAAIRIDEAAAELERLGGGGTSPESGYEEEWFRCLKEDAIAELAASLRHDGKDVYFQVFRAYCLEPADGTVEPTYDNIARQFGVKETDVRNYLTRCRQALRQIIRDRIREYAGSDEDVEAELRRAIGV